ncbi:MAG: glycosyltransferase family 4 protein, partial [Gammaproteobacteria bacterium]|nr:glycosyltransferase family 4 protein [Gammaproteobacteria bacterium]
PDRVRREYVDADLFVLPSYLEGYGMALAEAIAHGVPVVSTTAGAIPDTLPSAAARLVPPGDVTALTDVLRELIGDAARRSALAEQARAAAPSIPTWPQAIDRFAATLDRYAGR